MRVWSVVLAALVAAPAAAQHAPPPIAVRDTTLANGLQIYVIENHAVPLVSEGFLVRGGALAQDSGQAGVPNLYLHTPAIAERAFHRDLAQMRGSATVAAQQEFVARFIVIPAANANDGLSALSRVLHNPDFTYDGLKLARTTVFGELQTTQAHPEYALHRAVDARLWSTAWGRKDILGDPITTATATTATLDAFYRRYYIPNNAAIVVSGDVSAAAIFRAAQHAFGRWRPGPDPFAAHPVPPIPGPDSRKAIILIGPVQDVTVVIDWQGPSAGQTSNLTYAAEVFSGLFNDPASRVQLDLVQSGLFQQLSINYATQQHVGPIEIVGHTTLIALPHALAALKRELAACAVPGAFDDDALTASRQGNRVARALEMESAVDAARIFAFWWGNAGANYYAGYADHVQAVTAADITAYVTTYLEQPYVIGVLGPNDTSGALSSPVQTFATDSVP